MAAIVRDLARLTLESHQGEETLELTAWYGTPVAELTSPNRAVLPST